MSASPILTRSRYRVFTRLHWSDPWVVNTYLECIHCTRSAAPAVSTAAFRWRSGTIKREDGTTFEEVIALDFKELFVRVQAITISTDPDTLEDIEEQTTIWVGRMYDEEYKPGGVDAGPYADDVIKAYGLEHELDRITIGKSRIVNDETDPVVRGRRRAQRRSGCRRTATDHRRRHRRPPAGDPAPAGLQRALHLRVPRDRQPLGAQLREGIRRHELHLLRLRRRRPGVERPQHRQLPAEVLPAVGLPIRAGGAGGGRKTGDTATPGILDGVILPRSTSAGRRCWRR
jgi:hypothetical protein